MHNLPETSTMSTVPLPAQPNAASDDPLIARLGSHHRQRVLAHLLSLPASDRRLRFGLFASDETIESYVRGIHFSRDAVFGAVGSSARLIAVGHLAFERGAEMTRAELGISVQADHRRRGLGIAILRRAAEHARNRGARTIVMSYVPENDALEELAKRAGMRLTPDPFEKIAHLALEPPSAASLLAEAIGGTMAALNLGLRMGDAGNGVATSA
jgi:GNAT superfamily N-acetyltransferase